MDVLKKEGETYGDFSLVNYKIIDELQSVLREIIHIPTGAQVMHIENADPENVFCLSFKTLPDSSNGAAHILEHTVLCGSRKFPVKDPFFSMNRRSLNTFMNAMTGSDFTCYPAASQVEKDFYNLLDVYIDAVFHPLLKEESFLQEGHRLEFKKQKDPKSPLEFKGIVYNEMKGAMSSADSRIYHKLMEEIVPDLPYAFNSGGEPKDIPSLTYKQLIEFHETFYHQSRCLFFFYGNLPLKKHLDFIEENALQGVKRVSPLDGIKHQNRFEKPVHKNFTYPISEKEDLQKNTIHAIGWLTAPLLEQEDVLALTVLDSVLMDTDASLLKKMLLDTKLCIQAESWIDTEMTDVPFLMFCRGLEKGKGKELEKALFSSLKKIAKQGIPYHLIEASIHQLEFSRMEITGDHSPFGLTLFMRSALAKQHGCAPENALQVHSLFEGILEKAKNPHFFTPLIEKYFLKNSHFVSLSFDPDPTIPKKEAEAEKKQLEKIKDSLTEKEIAKILDQTKWLKKFQKEVEGQKLDCLPKVTLDDVPKKTKHFPLIKARSGDLTILHHDTFTNHIVYADLVFDLPKFTDEELFDLQLFILLWPELGMGKRTYQENLEEIHAHTGGLGAHISLHVQAEDPKQMRPTLQVHGKALSRKSDKLFNLLTEMVEAPRFDEEERIDELLKKLANALQNRLTKNSMRYASQLSLAGLSIPSTINEKWHGLSFYNFVMKHYKKPKLIIEKMTALRQKLLYKGDPKLILSCDEPLYKEMEKKQVFPSLKKGERGNFTPDFSLQRTASHAREITSPVAFTAYGFKTVNYSHKDAPALQVATLLLENKILHHRIREQGGAYGAGASYNPLWGNFYFYSYRDPHIAHSYRTFKDSITEIVSGNFTATDLEEAKLGIIQHLDTPISPGSRAMAGFILERDGKTNQMRQNFRDYLLKLKEEDIQSALKENLESQLDAGTLITFAGKELLEKELPLIEDKKLEILKITDNN